MSSTKKSMNMSENTEARKKETRRRMSQYRSSIRGLKEAFDYFDVEGTGEIKSKDLNKVIKRFASKQDNVSFSQTNLMIETFEPDDNEAKEEEGELSIDFKSFQVVVKKVEEDEDTLLKDAFKLVDTNGDNKVSRKELRTFLNKIDESLSDKDFDELFKAADTNGDGHIDMDEF
eukprot:UN26139